MEVLVNFDKQDRLRVCGLIHPEDREYTVKECLRIMSLQMITNFMSLKNWMTSTEERFDGRSLSHDEQVTQFMKGIEI